MEFLAVEQLRDDISASAADFSKALTELGKAYEKDVGAIIRWTVLKVFRNIVKRSPVLTGTYRGSHAISNIEPVLNDVTGAQNVKKGKGLKVPVPEATWIWKVGDGNIWIYNNLPYAERLENGWSKQAPAGVYRLALREVTVFLNQKTAQAKGFEPGGIE
jgi:hypothetical protein